MTNREKHQQCISLVSNHLSILQIEHIVDESINTHDIKILNTNQKIKIFSNMGKNTSINVERSFEPDEDILYLVVSSTRKNIVGYTCVGGYGNTVKDSIKTSNTIDSTKNIQLDKLGFISFVKRLLN